MKRKIPYGFRRLRPNEHGNLPGDMLIGMDGRGEIIVRKKSVKNEVDTNKHFHHPFIDCLEPACYGGLGSMMASHLYAEWSSQWVLFMTFVVGLSVVRAYWRYTND
jgi:hypothetical protein